MYVTYAYEIVILMSRTRIVGIKKYTRYLSEGNSSGFTIESFPHLIE